MKPLPTMQSDEGQVVGGGGRAGGGGGAEQHPRKTPLAPSVGQQFPVRCEQLEWAAQAFDSSGGDEGSGWGGRDGGIGGDGGGCGGSGGGSTGADTLGAAGASGGAAGREDMRTRARRASAPPS